MPIIDKKQRSFVDDEDRENVNKLEWEKEWQDMPEFIQKNKNWYAEILVRFENEEDLQKFAKLVDQQLDKKTKSIWYPKLRRGKCGLWRWTDES